MTRLQGPVEKVNGRLLIRIPLAEGGEDLIVCCRGLGYVEDDMLHIPIGGPMAEGLGISEGTLVVVDNENGKLNLFVAD